MIGTKPPGRVFVDTAKPLGRVCETHVGYIIPKPHGRVDIMTAWACGCVCKFNTMVLNPFSCASCASADVRSQQLNACQHDRSYIDEGGCSMGCGLTYLTR